MRVSNRILIGFILFAFLLPVIVFMSFKKKIKNNDYYVVENTAEWNDGRISIKTPGLIVIKATGEHAVCEINVSADTASYYRFIADKDGNSAELKGDTLYVNMDGKDYRHTLYLNLPVLPEVIAEGVAVEITNAASATAENLLVTLRKGSTLSIGNREEKVPGEEAPVLEINKLSVKADRAKIKLGQYTRVQWLQLALADSTVLELADASTITGIEGKMDTTTVIKSPARYIVPLSKTIQ